MSSSVSFYSSPDNEERRMGPVSGQDVQDHRGYHRVRSIVDGEGDPPPGGLCVEQHVRITSSYPTQQQPGLRQDLGHKAQTNTTHDTL
jgi:hypothetical protein